MHDAAGVPPVEAAFERALVTLDPLDRARGALLSLVAPIARPLFGDRGLRVVVLGGISMSLSFVLAWRVPMALLALGPLLLGVPHLLADVRYLVARPGFARRPAFWLFVLAPLLIVYARPEVWVGLVSAIGAALVARASRVRRALAVAGLACLAALAYAHRGAAELWMAHAHNLVALAMWTLFFHHDASGARAGRARRVVLPVAFAVLSALLFLIPLPEFSVFAGVDPLIQELVLSPVPSASLAPRFVAFFAFAQSVHYAVWVRSVPDEARPREGIRSFASSMRALRLDVGSAVLAASVLAFFALLAWAIVDLEAARLGYFRLALSHGYLEVAVAGLCVLEGRVLA